jgi:hypothetical protein
MVKRLAGTALAAFGMAIVWVLSRWDDATLYDDMEDEDPDAHEPPTPPEPEDDE